MTRSAAGPAGPAGPAGAGGSASGPAGGAAEAAAAACATGASTCSAVECTAFSSSGTVPSACALALKPSARNNAHEPTTAARTSRARGAAGLSALASDVLVCTGSAGQMPAPGRLNQEIHDKRARSDRAGAARVSRSPLVAPVSSRLSSARRRRRASRLPRSRPPRWRRLRWVRRRPVRCSARPVKRPEPGSSALPTSRCDRAPA
jgi:hypothetical protein